MVQFETIKLEEIKFGNSQFIEVARKKAIVETGENEFISVSRGFYLPDGSKRFKGKSIAIPNDKDLKEALAKKIKEI